MTPGVPIRRWSEHLGIRRNVAVLAVSIFGLGLGEELWQVYLPKYLSALGASGFAVGLFASAKDLLDGLYQYPGGWAADRFGRKRALILFTATAMAGYAAYAASTHWTTAFVGLLCAMGWKAGAFPVTFAVIGDSLPQGRRTMAFSIQSILVRVPRVIGSPLGGLLIAALGVTAGVRVALLATLVVALVVLLTQRWSYREPPGARRDEETTPVRVLWTIMPEPLKRLLLADCLVRVGEGLAASFIILYVTGDLRISIPEYGTLYAIQQSVAIALYLPAGRLAELTGRKPLVALTFLFFALFPLIIRFSEGFPLLVVAFVVGGLKEMGEPARKSLIVDLATAAHRGRIVGVYYTIRNLLVVPAGALGGLMWQRSTTLPLVAACVVTMFGALVYLVTWKDVPIDADTS